LAQQASYKTLTNFCAELFFYKANKKVPKKRVAQAFRPSTPFWEEGAAAESLENLPK
jgi:hypothetical protein